MVEEYTDYDALVYINDKWQKINENIIITQDLEDYVKKTDLNDYISNINLTDTVTETKLNEKLANYLKTEEIQQLASNNYLNAASSRRINNEKYHLLCIIPNYTHQIKVTYSPNIYNPNENLKEATIKQYTTTLWIKEDAFTENTLYTFNMEIYDQILLNNSLEYVNFLTQRIYRYWDGIELLNAEYYFADKCSKEEVDAKIEEAIGTAIEYINS